MVVKCLISNFSSFELSVVTPLSTAERGFFYQWGELLYYTGTWVKILTLLGQNWLDLTDDMNLANNYFEEASKKFRLGLSKTPSYFQ